MAAVEPSGKAGHATPVAVYIRPRHGDDPDARRPDDPDRVARQVERWRTAGATHLCINTMGLGLEDVDAHLDALTRAAQQAGVAPG